MALLDTLKSLADESRLRMVRILSFGYFNVQELTAIMDLSQSTVSHHLKVLQREQLTRIHKEGTWSYYSLALFPDETSISKIIHGFLSRAEQEESGPLKQVFLRDRIEAEKLLTLRREQSHRFFEAVAGQWKEMREEAHGNVSSMETLIENIPPGQSVLDLGCGSGALLEMLLPRPGETIGVDYSQKMLEEAKHNLRDRSDRLDLRLGYLEHLPLGDTSVDVAIAYMVLHHVPNPEDAIQDAFRVLKPEGVLHIVDLRKHDNEYMRERFADLWLGFDPKVVQEWATKSGFKLIEEKHSYANMDEIFYLICKKEKQHE